MNKLLGGLMKKPILLLLVAFMMQYASDFNFLYQTIHATWSAGGYGDLLYFVAYCTMFYSLISFNSVFKKQAQVPDVSADQVEAS